MKIRLQRLPTTLLANSGTGRDTRSQNYRHTRVSRCSAKDFWRCVKRIVFACIPQSARLKVIVDTYNLREFCRFLNWTDGLWCVCSTVPRRIDRPRTAARSLSRKLRTVAWRSAVSAWTWNFDQSDFFHGNTDKILLKIHRSGSETVKENNDELNERSHDGSSANITLVLSATYLPEEFYRRRADRLDVDDIYDVAAKQRGFGDGHVWRVRAKMVAVALPVVRIRQCDSTGHTTRGRQTVSVFGADQKQIRLTRFQRRWCQVRRLQPPRQRRPSVVLATRKHFHL